MKAYWWRGHANFGDLLTPLILGLAGVEAEWAAPKDAQLIGIGSIATHVPPGWGGLIFGSGKPRMSEKIDLSTATVLALRGKLTANGSGARGDFVLGDPGLLVSLLPIKASEDIPLGIIPHWEDRKLAGRYPKGELIDVQGDPLAVIAKIASCRRIVSSSLHGIIVADAFGKERRWERSPRAWPFKFADYGSVVGRFEPDRWGRVNPNVLQRTTESLSGALARLADLSGERWAEVPNRWEGRLERMALHVPNGSSVLDLGAGSEALRPLLHESCRYTPADVKQRSPECLIVDFQTGTYPEGRWDVLIASGVLEYSPNLAKTLVALRKLAPMAIVSYQPIVGRMTKDRMRRGWRNHLTKAKLPGRLPPCRLQRQAGGYLGPPGYLPPDMKEPVHRRPLP